MYGSYSSYSSSCSAAQPLDITPSRTQSYSSAYCAFPSWPQRSSLAETAQHGCPRASSYLSDDDLYLYDLDEDAQSVSSSGSSIASGSPSLSEQQLLEMQRQQEAMQREAAMKFLIAEKERRRQALKQKRRSSPGARKSPKSKGAMTPIVEAAE